MHPYFKAVKMWKMNVWEFVKDSKTLLQIFWATAVAGLVACSLRLPSLLCRHVLSTPVLSDSPLAPGFSPGFILQGQWEELFWPRLSRGEPRAWEVSCFDLAVPPPNPFVTMLNQHGKKLPQGRPCQFRGGTSLGLCVLLSRGPRRSSVHLRLFLALRSSSLVRVHLVKCTQGKQVMQCARPGPKSKVVCFFLQDSSQGRKWEEGSKLFAAKGTILALVSVECG